MNTPTKAGIALAVLTLVWAGGTAFSGNQLQSNLADKGPLGATPDGSELFKVVKRDYNKTFLGATRTLTLQVGCAADGTTPVQVVWRDHIEHGPLPGFTSFGAARIRTQIELDAATRAELKARIGSEELPLDIVTQVGIAGGYATTLTGKDIRMTDAKTGMQVALLGMKATIDAGRGGDTRVHYELGSYTAADARVRVEFQGAKGSLRGQAPHWYAMATEGDGTMQLITMRMNGDGAADAKPLLQLKDMHWTQTGKTEGELYTAQGTLKGSGEANGHKLDAVNMTFAMKNLHAPTYAKLMAALSTPMNACGSAKPADPAAAALARLKPMQESFLALLPHNPSVALEDLSVTYAGQTAKFSYTLGTEGVTEADIKGGFGPALINKFGFKARAEAPVAMLKAVAKTQNQAPEMVDGMLAQSVARGMVQRNGDLVVMEAVAAKGQFKLNGRPMPVPGFTGAPPAADAAASAPPAN